MLLQEKFCCITALLTFFEQMYTTPQKYKSQCACLSCLWVIRHFLPPFSSWTRIPLVSTFPLEILYACVHVCISENVTVDVLGSRKNTRVSCRLSKIFPREMCRKRDVYGNRELCLWISWALQSTFIPIFCLGIKKNFCLLCPYAPPPLTRDIRI